MGLVPTDLDAVYDSVEASAVPSGGGGGLLPEGEYTGTVLESVVGESMKPWVTAELKLKLQVTEGEHSGKVTFCDVELAPNTDKSGQPNQKKLGFVKGQLANLGYAGKISEVEYVAQNFVGAVIEFRQKVDTHILEGGAFDQYARINPNTNQPYVDREVYVNKLVTPGFAQAAPAAPSEPQVY